MSEARRGLIRLSSNYVRLFTNVVLGLVAVRLLLSAVGNDGWAVIALLGSTIGLASMAESIVDRTMIRELGSAYHSKNPADFGAAFNTAVLLMLAIGGLTAVLVVVIWIIIPFLEVPPHLIGAARWMVFFKGIETVVLVLFAPWKSMYKVTERMVGANIGVILNRTGPFLAALWLAITFNKIDPARGVITYAVISATLVVIFKLAHSGWLMTRDRRFLPEPALASRDALKGILQIGGWNTAAAVTGGLHIRVDSILMNLYFGLFGNVIFGLATVLSGYVRMITTGMTIGIDAVATRIDATGEARDFRRLVYHSTRLHAMATLPAAIGMWMLADDILIAWVGDRLQDPEQTLAPTVMLIRLLTIGMAFRAIGDGWIALLYGSGHVKKYAPASIVGGVLNPVLAIVLILVLPDDYAYVGPTISYGLIFITINMGYIPWQMSRVLDQSVWKVLQPIWKVLFVSLTCAPLLYFIPNFNSLHLFANLAIHVATYAVSYGMLTYIFVLNPGERSRMLRVATRLTGKRRHPGKASADPPQHDG